MTLNKIVPWTEKYRPTTVNDIVSHESVISTLKKCLSNENFDGFPNLLFYGRPGTGKTSTIVALCKQLFQELYEQRVLELNASDERGIQVVRDKIKSFAQLSASSHCLKSGDKCPSFKMIILDEADAMTTFAQAALRRTMEVECKTTRFCLICNYVSKLIEPIISRCMVFRFRDLPEQSIVDQLNRICTAEEIKLDQSALKFLIENCKGDLRWAINTLQSPCARALKLPVIEIDLVDVQTSSGVIPESELIPILSTKSSIATIQRNVKQFLKTGYSVRQLVHQLQNCLLNDTENTGFMSDDQLVNVLEKFAIVDKRLMDGASEYLQLIDLFNCLNQNKT